MLTKSRLRCNCLNLLHDPKKKIPICLAVRFKSRLGLKHEMNAEDRMTGSTKTVNRPNNHWNSLVYLVDHRPLEHLHAIQKS